MILSYKKMKISSCSHEVYIVKFWKASLWCKSFSRNIFTFQTQSYRNFISYFTFKPFYEQLLHLENSDLLISFSYPRVSIILAFYHCNYRLRQIIQLHVFSLSTCISCCIEGSKSLLSCVCSVKSLQIRKDYQRDNDMAKSCFFANFYSGTPRVDWLFMHFEVRQISNKQT